MMTNTTEVKRFEPYTDEGNREGYGQMEPCEGGDWVRATDYDALAAKLAVAERRERQLLDTTATCRTLRRELNTAKAELAAADAMIEAQQKDYASNNVRFAEAEHRAEAAEAALPAVYQLALGDAAGAALGLGFGGFYDPIRKKAATAVIDLPTPTAAELMARIQTGEKE